MWKNIKNRWFQFWYYWKNYGPVVYGGGPNGSWIFRKQRLINVVLFMMLMLIITLLIL